MMLIPKDHPRILLVRRDNIGDLACTTPAIAALRAHYPDAEIGALVNSYNAEVLRGNPSLDKVFVYQKLKHAGSLGRRVRALGRRLRLIAALRRWRPDVTILAKASYDRHGLGFARQIGARNIIGYVPHNLSRIMALPDIRLATPEFASVHEVQAVNGLLKPLGIDDALGPLQVFPDVGVVEQLRLRLKLSLSRNFIALHISAREPERRWGLDNFVALAKHILGTQPAVQILLLWSPGKSDDPHHPGDDEAAMKLVQAVNSSRLIPVVTQSLTELIATLSLCNAFIGTDGGAMHLAAALNKKVLAMFENKPDKLRHWYPWCSVSQTIYSSSTTCPNIANIQQSQVFEALRQIMTTRRAEV